MSRRRRADDDRGTVMVLALGGMLLALTVALVLADASSLFMRRTALMAVADEAAIAAASAIDVAALYEQGRVLHCGPFVALEEELMALGSGDLEHSPDRADALVWAVSELMLGAAHRPRLRAL